MTHNRQEIKKYNWFEQNYGSRRGFVRTYWRWLVYYLGGYGKYRPVDWKSIDRLVFICKGNICRSAYAEAVAKALGINAISCGLDTIEDAPANSDAIRTAETKGVSLKEHKTTPIMYLALKKTDLLIAMEPWQAEFLYHHLVRNHQITLLGLWSQPIRPHIQDPYGSSAEYFELCFNYIEKCVHELAVKIKK